MITYKETYINDALLPRAWSISAPSASIEDACAWLEKNKGLMNDIIDTEGALLIRGFKCIKSAADFEKALEVISSALMDYIGGTSPRKNVQGKIVTATELPCEYSIPLHQEMSYTDNPPERIAFFCQKPAEHRGYTTIADMRKLTTKIDPDVVKRFEAGGVQLRRTLPSEESLDKKPGISKSWAETFDTTDKKEVDRIVEEKGWRTQWLDDGSVQLWQTIRPAKKHYDKTGDDVWFNQAHVFSQATTLFWAKKDGRLEQLARLEDAIKKHPEMMDQVFHKGEIPIADEDVMHLYQVMENNEIPVALQPSDIMILNNTLVSHGRTSYQGKRDMLAALIA